MNVREFSRHVARIMPQIHAAFVKRQPDILMKGRITLSHMLIMDILREKGECKMSELSNIVGVTRSAVTGITDRLIGAKLVKRTRSRKDRRVVRVRLTEKGRRITKKVHEYKLKLITALFANISEKERAAYLGILRKVSKNIQQ